MCGAFEIDQSNLDRVHRRRKPSEPTDCLQLLSSLDQLPDLLDDVARAMKREGFGERDRFAVRLALEEAVVNAVKHGHRHDPRKQVRVWWVVTASSVRVIVEDEGPGFDPSQVPDPRLPENQERGCGRGLFLMHAYMTWVRFNRRGNSLAMCRHRSRLSSRDSPPAYGDQPGSAYCIRAR